MMKPSDHVCLATNILVYLFQFLYAFTTWPLTRPSYTGADHPSWLVLRIPTLLRPDRLHRPARHAPTPRRHLPKGAHRCQAVAAQGVIASGRARGPPPGG